MSCDEPKHAQRLYWLGFIIPLIICAALVLANVWLAWSIQHHDCMQAVINGNDSLSTQRINHGRM